MNRIEVAARALDIFEKEFEPVPRRTMRFFVSSRA